MSGALGLWYPGRPASVKVLARSPCCFATSTAERCAGAGRRRATVPRSRPLEGVVDHLGEGDRGVVARSPFGIAIFQRSRCDHGCFALALVEQLLHTIMRNPSCLIS